LTRAAAIVLVLAAGTVLFDIFSPLTEEYPLFGLFTYSLVPILFAAGGIVFIVAILRIGRGDGVGGGGGSGLERTGRLVFLMLAGAASIVLLVVGGVQLVEFTDTTAFCGRLCHELMYPEYTAQQAAPHARVSCAACHVGPGSNYFVRSKISGLGMVVSTLTGNYHRPVPTPIENLRPAREVCEQCHWPAKFSRDLIRVHTTYAPDKDNTPKTTAMVLKVGGGEAGVARNIHWHMSASVYYVAADKERQKIAWIDVENSDGTSTQYIDPALAGRFELASSEKRLMDCMDCHNRATHIFQSPEVLIDLAIDRGQIDASLPYVKSEALRRLGPPSPSLEAANTSVEGIRDFYRTMYPDVYQTKRASIEKAIEALKEVARLTTFPEMNVNYRTYISFAGHDGCFRCHGKLVVSEGPDKGQVVSASCKGLCHTTAPVPG